MQRGSLGALAGCWVTLEMALRVASGWKWVRGHRFGDEHGEFGTSRGLLSNLWKWLSGLPEWLQAGNEPEDIVLGMKMEGLHGVLETSLLEDAHLIVQSFVIIH